MPITTTKTRQVADANITYAKVQDISAANVILGRYSGGAGVAQELSVGAGLAISGSSLIANILGTANYLPKFTAASTIGDSTISQYNVGLDVVTDFGNTSLVAIDAIESSNISTNQYIHIGVGNSPVSTSSTLINTNFNADLLDGQHGTHYLSRANHTGTQTSATISDFTTGVRGLFSTTATGLTYTSSTGVLSLTSGYAITTNSQITNFNTAYTWGDHNAMGYIVNSNNVAIGDGSGTPVDLTFDGNTLLWTIGVNNSDYFYFKNGLTTRAQLENTGILTLTNTNTLTLNPITGEYAGIIATLSGSVPLAFTNTGTGNALTYVYNTVANGLLFDISNAITTAGAAGATFKQRGQSQVALYIDVNTTLNSVKGAVGVRTTTPLSAFEVNGSFGLKIRANLSGNQTLQADDFCLEKTSAGTATYTLPAANTCAGRMYSIINHSTGAITTSIAYRTATATTTTSIAAGARVIIISDGAEWLLVAN